MENAGAATDELPGSGFKQTEESEQEISGIVHRPSDDNIKQEQGEEDIQTAPSVETLAATAGITGKSEESVPASETIQNESLDPKERALTHAAEPLKGTLTGMFRSFPLFLIKYATYSRIHVVNTCLFYTAVMILYFDINLDNFRTPLCQRT